MKRDGKNKFYRGAGVVNYNDFSLGSTKVSRTVGLVEMLFINHWYECKGEVHPTDFTGKVTFERDCEIEVWFVGIEQPRISTFSGTKGEASNDSNEDWSDTNPPVVYDLDGPGSVRKRTDENGNIREVASMLGVYNFRVFTACSGIRCSDVLEFYVEVVYKSSTDQFKSTLVNGYKASMLPSH